MKKENRARRLILGMLILVIGLVWGAPVSGQDTEKTIYNDHDVAYQEALRRIEEARVSGAVQLHLPQMFLAQLPPEIGQLTTLQMLSLYGDNLTALPPEIGKLTSLQDLHLAHNRLAMLPPEIGQLTQLEALYLEGNLLTTLPPQIGQLTNLQVLYLDHNEFTTLPPEIGKLTALLSLTVTENQLTTLPSEIGKLANLQELHLFQNQLTTLPAEIGQLSNLSWLDVTGNPLATLPFEIGHLTQLEILLTSSLTFPSPEIVAQGTPAILTYLRDYEAKQAEQTRLVIAGIAAGVGGIAGVMLAFRWRQRRGLHEKKKWA